MKYEVISAVCETENFTKAAEKLNYSQSAVSQAVRNFEKELGITLFERSKKGVTPLEEVKPIIDSIRKIGEEEKKIKEYAKAIKESETGVVRVAYLGDKIEKWFLELFRTFGEKYPKIRFEIWKKSLGEVETDMKKGLLDFAFSFSVDTKEFEFIPYGKEELVVFLPKNHKLASQEFVTLEDLRAENILLAAEDDALKSDRIKQGIELQNDNSQFYFSEDSMALKFVEQAQGICILPESFADFKESGWSIVVKSFEKKYYRTWGMVYLKNKNLTNAAQKFLNHISNMNGK